MALPNDIDKQKVWCPVTEAYINSHFYDNKQITKKTTKDFSIVMHFNINILAYAHPDYDWIGGIEAELHEKKPEVRMRRGIMRKTCRLLLEPQK